jgi:hypothetical protein
MPHSPPTRRQQQKRLSGKSNIHLQVLHIRASRLKAGKLHRQSPACQQGSLVRQGQQRVHGVYCSKVVVVFGRQHPA